MNEQAAQLHKDSIIIDGTCPLLAKRKYVDWYIEGGCTVVTPTVGGFNPMDETLSLIGKWLRFIREREDLVLIERAGQVLKAKEEGKTGVILHLQGPEAVADDLDLIDVVKRLGVGIIQLTYNVENRLGYGCQTPDNGLKPFGKAFIDRCNQAKVIVDCSHTGYRTTMDAIEYSDKPVIFSHANPMALWKTQSARNVEDDQIRAVAESGGLTGVTGFPGFISGEEQPSLQRFIEHIDHFVEIGGIDHVALGIDYYMGQWPVVEGEAAQAEWESMVDGGHWKGPEYPPPPHRYPAGIETPRTLPLLTAGLLDRGYSPEDVQKIMGLNLLRLYRDIWGD
ncbi:MAG: dipeptidase [Candidatus Competibacteraceae bacterium]|jgi:membrane dipeptidase|nr:dipeptidase [Candidatus Competibacteraceae bacterium]